MEYIKTSTGNIYYKSVIDQAKTLESWRLISGKSVKDWCAFLAVSNPTYQQIKLGKTGLNSKMIAVLLHRGYDLHKLFFHELED